MTTEAFIKIAGSVLTILVTLISVYLVPAIKANMTKKDMNTLMYYVQIAVRCADQIYTKEQWQEKKEYVFSYICKVVEQYLHIKLTEQDINILIEGVVNDIHDNGVKE